MTFAADIGQDPYGINTCCSMVSCDCECKYFYCRPKATNTDVVGNVAATLRSAQMATRLELFATPETALEPSSPDYERRLRLGAIRVRRDAADDARRRACDADLLGDLGTAYRLHVEADRHEDAITQYMLEIGLLNMDELRSYGQVVESQQRAQRPPRRCA